MKKSELREIIREAIFEKMTEELTINNKTKKTKHPDIKLATDPTYTSQEIYNLLNDLK